MFGLESLIELLGDLIDVERGAGSARRSTTVMLASSSMLTAIWFSRWISCGVSAEMETFQKMNTFEEPFLCLVELTQGRLVAMFP